MRSSWFSKEKHELSVFYHSNSYIIFIVETKQNELLVSIGMCMQSHCHIVVATQNKIGTSPEMEIKHTGREFFIARKLITIAIVINCLFNISLARHETPVN